MLLPDFGLITPKLQTRISQLLWDVQRIGTAFWTAGSMRIPTRGRTKNPCEYFRNGARKREGGKWRRIWSFWVNLGYFVGNQWQLE